MVGMRTPRCPSDVDASCSSHCTPASPRLSVSAMMCACETATKSLAPKKSPTLIWCRSAVCGSGPALPARMSCSSDVNFIDRPLRRNPAPLFPSAANSSTSFDHFIGDCNKRRRHLEAEGLRGLEVDDEFICRWLQHRQVRRAAPVKDLSDVDAALAKTVGKIGAIDHQFSGVGILAPWVNRGYCVTGRERDELILSADQKPIGGDHQCFDLVLRQCCEDAVYFLLVTGADVAELEPERVRGDLQILQLGRRIGIGRIAECGDRLDAGYQFAQQLEAFGAQPGEHESNAGHIPGRSVDTRHQT